MATDFTYNGSSITSSGGLSPNSTDTPLDVRCRVELESDILNIPKPYLGMLVYAKNTGKLYVVTSLKNKTVAGISTPNAAVNTYVELSLGGSSSEGLTEAEVTNLLNERLDHMSIDVLTTAEYNALSSTAKNDPTKIYILSDSNATSIDLSSYVTKEVLDDYTGGKKLRYLTEVEYNNLTNEEKNDEATVYAITDLTEVILTSPNGNKFILTVSDNGELGVEPYNG